MARTYHRDARGRFAPKGYSGQTGGRGARLKSAGKARKGGGARSAADGFPDSSIAKSVVRQAKIGPRFTDDRKRNLVTAAKYVKSKGYKVSYQREGEKGHVASYLANTNAKGTVNINVDSPAWNNPDKYMRRGGGNRLYSTTRGRGVLDHEMGHRRQPKTAWNAWDDYNNPKIQAKLQTATRVSTYGAIGGPGEFIAEYRAGRASGRRYTPAVNRLYREVTGERMNQPNPSRRRRRK